MSDRHSTATPSSGGEAMMERIAQALTRLGARLSKVEQASNQWAPADCRFERDIDPDTGELYVVVVRVSTGNRQRITGPL